MHNFIDFITKSGPQVQLYLFVTLFIFIWNIENIGGVIFTYKKWKHAFTNAAFIFTNIPGQLLLGLAFVKTTEWTTQHQFGFLFNIPFCKNPFWFFIASFIYLDFGEYLYHVVMHKVKRLWMFHVVHHSDPVVDISTTLREHPGENFIRLSFTLIWVFISGTMFWMLMLRQIIQAATTSFAHMNYRLPEKADSIVSLLFITPNLHQVHHHYKQPYTDCNYGDVLSIWDRMFGTLKRLPANELVFGVDTYMEREVVNKFPALARLPFGKYKKSSTVLPDKTKNISDVSKTKKPIYIYETY